MASLKKRGSIFYIQYYLGGQQRRVSTDTDNLHIAKAKLRQIESAQMRGDLNPQPTKTPIADVVTAYVEHIRAVKTAKSAQMNIYYLRDAFSSPTAGLRLVTWSAGQIARSAMQQDRRRSVAPGVEPGEPPDRLCSAAAARSHTAGRSFPKLR